ncbi:hypothetical protein [Shimia biformata]|uniref:hypothetical protein n=1 Tax=Shimia biformata TaxID=1294299 RepID=UPI00194E218E|nr:hypothetical protein [Shimia biformata]
MKYDWILDVLTDLRDFSQANGLAALADQLDDARLVAATEVASALEGTGALPAGDENATRNDIGAAGVRANA